MAMRNPVGRVNYQPNSFGEGPRESPQRGFRSFAERGGRPEGPSARRELRRPLQPGAPVLQQPDRAGADAYRHGADLRAFQGRDAGHPRAHGVASPEHRRRLGRDRRRQARHEEIAQAGGRGGRAAGRSRTIAGAQHHRERAGQLCWPQGRRACQPRRRCRAAEEAPGGDREGRRGDGGHCAQGRRRRGGGWKSGSRPST